MGFGSGESLKTYVGFEFIGDVFVEGYNTEGYRATLANYGKSNENSRNFLELFVFCHFSHTRWYIQLVYSRGLGRFCCCME